MLVRRSKMRSVRRAQSFGYAFEYQPLGRAHPAEQRHVLGAHDAGVNVREKVSLFQHELGHRREIGDRRCVTQRA